jgi:hypothetical protein
MVHERHGRYKIAYTDDSCTTACWFGALESKIHLSGRLSVKRRSYEPVACSSVLASARVLPGERP